MNSKQRILARLAGQPVDRPPNANLFTTFAARYIGQPLSTYYLDYRVLCEANLALLEPFQVDLVQAVSDPYRETADFGAEILFPEDSPPVCRQPLLSEPADLLKLNPPAPYNSRRMSDRLMAVRYFKEQVGETTPVMGWVEGALAQAAHLRGAAGLVQDLLERPAWALDLLEIAAQVEIEFARLQVASGADIVGLGDSLAAQLSPDLYRRFALPFERRIVDAVHASGGLARLHIEGDTTPLLPDLVHSGAEIIDVDAMVDFSLAGRVFGCQAAPCGNLDPQRILLRGDPGLVRQEVWRALAQGGPRCLNAASHEIPDGVPEANLLAQTQALQDYPAA